MDRARWGLPDLCCWPKVETPASQHFVRSSGSCGRELLAVKTAGHLRRVAPGDPHSDSSQQLGATRELFHDRRGLGGHFELIDHPSASAAGNGFGNPSSERSATTYPVSADRPDNRIYGYN
jgi:hypothetical protein